MTSSITPQNAYDMLQKGTAILIDVREPGEFMAQHIPHALSLPLGMLERQFSGIHIPQDKTILFQCLKGRRGQSACEIISKSGACENTILNIEGGIDGWKEAGLPVMGHVQKISIFRQVQIIIGFLLATLVAIGLLGFAFAFYLAILFAAALMVAGITGWCGLALLLGKMPWNKP